MSGAALLFQRTGVAGNLVQPARMTLARALSPTRIRIDFDKPLDDNSVLRDPASYRIESASFGLVPFVASVRVPDVTAPRFVELATSEMTNLAPYTVRVEPFTVESSGVPVAPDALSFAGLGVGPELVVAVGVSPTRVDVRFTEPLKAMPVTRDPAGYTFSGGLVVESVLAIDEDTIALQTSEQTPGELYTLTVTAVVADHAKNPMWAANVTDVLGYTPDTQDARESIRIYDFLIEAIRTEDQKAGAFLERFLEGPQKIWEATLRTALDLPKLWSAEEMPDEALALQKHIVGWTDRLRAITDRLDPLALRRLIASSVKFWQQRGPEDSIIDALRMTTGARGRILNWFDYRWILGETHLGVENDGLDPWLLSSPFDGGDDDTQVYNVRIVDDGDLDRELVRAVVSLTRPLGEQAEVTYLALLDLFETDGDDSQWQQITGTSAVLAGRYSFGPASTATVAVDGAELWSEYVVRARMRGY